MGDALWWTIQTTTTSTFGPNANTFAGRIIGGIIMLVGIGITGSFISGLAAWIDEIKDKGHTKRKRSETDTKDSTSKGRDY